MSRMDRSAEQTAPPKHQVAPPARRLARTLAAAAAATAALAPPASAQLRVLDASGEMVSLDVPTTGRILLPLTTLSDTVVRPGFDSRGRVVVEAEDAARSVLLGAIVHGRNEIVIDSTAGLKLARDLRLPRSVLGPDGLDLVARAARLDDVGIGAAEVRVLAPEPMGEALLLFPRPGDSPGAPHRPRILQGADHRIDEAGNVDAIAFATLGVPDELRPLELAFDADDPNRLRAALPGSVEAAVREGASVTLVVTLEPGGGSASEASASAAAAPREAARRDLVLADATEALGARVSHLEGPSEQLDIRPTMGPGAAWGDVDEDGLLDLVVLQGRGGPGCAPLTDRLLLGVEGGGFRDASAASGLAAGDAGMGALLVDLDGDAHLDLYCANYGRDRLLLGAGDGTFRDASDLLPEHDLWSASVIAGDIDGDGDLDLYVTSYLDYDPAKMPDAAELGRYQREDPIEMLPFAFPGQRNVLLVNTLAQSGELGFVDRTEERGLLDVQGRGMQAVFWDFDLDGDEDLYVANDVSFNVLFRNEGDGTFEDVSFSTGLDDPRGGMGLALGDVEGDGDEDLFLTNWELEANALYLNSRFQHGTRKRRRASFHDATVRSGLGRSGIGRTSWGAELCDLDHDGVLDLFVANGYTSPDYESTGICVGQPDLLFRGLARGRFEEVPLGPGPAGARPPLAWRRASRGAIAGDLDRDGDLDLAVTSNNGPLRILENRSERRGGWLGVRLRRGSGGNRFGVGARVTVTTPEGAEVHRTLRAGQGYLTGNPPELHFGLGPVEEGAEVDVRVRWPDGVETRARVAAGQWFTLERDD